MNIAFLHVFRYAEYVGAAALYALIQGVDGVRDIPARLASWLSGITSSPRSINARRYTRMINRA